MEKTKNLYYIYHIPGKKIGMTRNINNRVIKCQGYKPGEFQILESSYDKEFIENKEHQWQEFFKYKKDFASYDNAEKSPINQFKSNKTMYTNVTDQTTTFNVPVNKLKGYLMDNLGHTFTTSYGTYIVNPELVRIIMANVRESMYRNTACYVYNKVLFEEVNKMYNTEPAPTANNPLTFDPGNVYDLIRQWAKERGIYTSGDSKTQYTKLCEESGELARAILKKDKEELTDAIGDMVVVLTNLAALEGLKIEDCVTSAYDVIKSRQGSMVNGTFVKDNPSLIPNTKFKMNPELITSSTAPSLTNHIKTTL
jgi:NTP pyrophosphatase (non-canonical NTP hydrolase)